jgi:hypothetical protein
VLDPEQEPEKGDGESGVRHLRKPSALSAASTPARCVSFTLSGADREMSGRMPVALPVTGSLRQLEEKARAA